MIWGKLRLGAASFPVSRVQQFGVAGGICRKSLVRKPSPELVASPEQADFTVWVSEIVKGRGVSLPIKSVS